MVIANIPDMNLTELNARDMRKAYMIIYSKINWEKNLLEKVMAQKKFAEFTLRSLDF